MVKSYIGFKRQIANLPTEHKAYLSKMEALLEGAGQYDIALAYIFMKLEEGHHRALKCGLIRLLKCNSQRVDDALQRQHFTRKSYQVVFKNIIGEALPRQTIRLLESAESIRDQQIHGKQVSQDNLRKGISDALSYIKEMGEFVESRTDKNPIGDLRGLAGRTHLLDGPTSFWVLKGVGLYVKEEQVQ